MPPCIMRIEGLTVLVGGEKAIDYADPQAGKYVKSYSASGHGGRGLLEVTDNVREAKTWPDASMALADWRRTSSTHPTRLDGQPNRPLTAYTVELLPAPEAEAP